MNKTIVKPTTKQIIEAFQNKDSVFLCPELAPRELEYYKTAFKQFAPVNSVGFLSSGSSGSPKIHIHSWSNLEKRALAQAKVLGLDQNSIYLNSLPSYHLAGFMPILRCLLSKAKLVDKKKDTDLKNTLLNIRPSHTSMVPTQLKALVEDKVNLDFLSSLLLGGSGCSFNVLAQARELGYPIRACYGMTESASFFAIGDSKEFLNTGEIKLYLMEGWKAYAQDSGRLTIESDEIYSGTIGSLGFKESQNILPTYDIGEVNHPEIKIFGRSDLVFKSGGMKVDPLEVEKKLEALELFRQVVIVPKQDDKWGSMTCAFISPFRKGRDYSLAVKDLPAHQRPKHFFPLPSATGIKPKRAELKLSIESQFKKGRKLPRVAFLHGFMGSENDLKELASAVKEACFPIMWKLPFHNFDNEYESFEEVVDFYVEKVRTEDIDALYGYSMGGRLATAIAEKLESLGEPLSGLILESSHPGLQRPEEKEKRLVSDQTLFERTPSSPDKFFESWYSQPLFGDFQKTELGKISIGEMIRRWDPINWKKSLEVLSTGRQKNYRSFLKNSSHPILYLCGSEDKKYKQLGEELAQSRPKKLEVKCLESGYHNLHLNHVESLKGPISGLLSSLN